jgi:hypothetical protein
MKFDIDATLKAMLKAIKDNVKKNWRKIKNTAADFLQDRKDRLEILANQKMNGEIDEEFFQKRLQDEKDILKADLLAEKIIAESIAQNAANAALNIFEKAIAAAIGI